MCSVNSDEHDAEHGVSSGPEQRLVTEQRNEPGPSSSQQYTDHYIHIVLEQLCSMWNKI
jgi:hypothetical protein